MLGLCDNLSNDCVFRENARSLTEIFFEARAAGSVMLVCHLNMAATVSDLSGCAMLTPRPVTCTA